VATYQSIFIQEQSLGIILIAFPTLVIICPDFYSVREGRSWQCVHVKQKGVEWGGISLVEISPSLGPQSPRNNVAGFALWLTLDNLFSPPNTSFHTQKGVFYIWTDRQARSKETSREETGLLRS